jgi:hypothetical protein
MNYQRIHDQIIDRARTRKLTGYKERHHIIPRCMGGDNSAENLVDLTAREHFIIHKLLCEIFPTEQKLQFAIWSMIHFRHKTHERKYILSNREYEYYRTLVSRAKSKQLSGKPLSDIHKQRISQSLKGKLKTEETKQKLRDANLGKTYTRSEEYRKKLSEANKGKIFSNEHKKHLSESHKGSIPWNKGKRLPKLSNEHKQKISNSLQGRIVSEDTRKKIGNIHRGKVTSEETKQKIRETKLRNNKSWKK